MVLGSANFYSAKRQIGAIGSRFGWVGVKPVDMHLHLDQCGGGVRVWEDDRSQIRDGQWEQMGGLLRGWPGSV